MSFNFFYSFAKLKQYKRQIYVNAPANRCNNMLAAKQTNKIIIIINNFKLIMELTY